MWSFLYSSYISLKKKKKVSYGVASVAKVSRNLNEKVLVVLDRIGPPTFEKNFYVHGRWNQLFIICVTDIKTFTSNYCICNCISTLEFQFHHFSNFEILKELLECQNNIEKIVSTKRRTKILICKIIGISFNISKFEKLISKKGRRGGFRK